MIFAWDEEDHDMFLEAIFQIGLAYQTGKLLLQAIFFFNLLKQVSTFLCRLDYKFLSLRHLGKCFLMLKMMHSAKVLLIKALYYAWYYASIDYESQIYDDLGLYYYYCSDIDKAYYYHIRSMRQMLFDQKLPPVVNAFVDIDAVHEEKFRTYYNHKYPLPKLKQSLT